MCFGGMYDRQRTLAIRIAAITLASDSAITIARFRPSKVDTFVLLSNSRRAHSLSTHPHKRVTMVMVGCFTTQAAIKIKHFRRGAHSNGGKLKHMLLTTIAAGKTEMGKIANRQSLAILDRGLKSQPFSQFCCIRVYKTNRQSRVSNRSFKSQRRQRFESRVFKSLAILDLDRAISPI